MPATLSVRTAAWRPIFDACHEGDAKRLETLLKRGADPNEQARSGWKQRPLHRLCEFRVSSPKHDGHSRCIELLLNAGADPAVRAGSTNMRPLELAALAGMVEATELLKRSPLDIFEAAAIGNVERVSKLLAKRPELAKMTDEAGCTALWYSGASRIYAGQIEIAELLLDAGANPDAFGLNVPILHMSTAHARNYAFAEYLLYRGADLHANTSLVHSACAFHFEFLMEGLSWFKAHDADFKRRDPETKQTAREKAESLRYHKIARWLE